MEKLSGCRKGSLLNLDKVMKIINIVFYEDPEPNNCNVLGTFYYKADARKWLRDHN